MRFDIKQIHHQLQDALDVGLATNLVRPTAGDDFAIWISVLW